jgi:hypothetical protein
VSDLAMAAPNPYQSPAIPSESDRPGKKFQINFAALSLFEYQRLAGDVVRGTVEWSLWKLKLNWSSPPVVSVQPPSQSKCDALDVPAELRKWLIEWRDEAMTLGFHGERYSLATSVEGVAVATELRMVHQNARSYLEICVFLSGQFYASKFNLASATLAGQILASSNGKLDVKRPPTTTCRYFVGLPLADLCRRHEEWLGTQSEPLKEFHNMADVEATMDHMAARFVDFQVARGYWIPLATEVQPAASAG